MIKSMITCDRCGAEMTEPWAEIRNRGDIYWGRPASMHMCDACAEDLKRWLKNEEAQHMQDLQKKNMDLQRYIAEHVVTQATPKTLEELRKYSGLDPEDEWKKKKGYHWT
jgi:hypothetical protein|nr:MAG TPA: YokU-like protein [Caudoviricetes sp.]